MKRGLNTGVTRGLCCACALVVSGLSFGCRSQRTGSTSAEVLPGPEAPVIGDRSALDHAVLKKGDTWTQVVPAAAIGPTPLPVYPPEALKARAPDYTLILTVTLDEYGKVSDIKRAFVSVEMPHPFSAQFREAAEAAIRSWNFVPARLNTFRVRDGKPDILIASETIPDEFDVKYTFASNGRVR